MLEPKKRKSVELAHGAQQKPMPPTEAQLTRHRASWGVTPTMFSALGLVQGLLGVDLRDSSQHPQFCFTFLLSIVGFSSPNTGLGQGAVDVTFLQQSISDFRELLSKSKAMRNYQNCLQRGTLRKHLLHTWDAMVLKMEKYKILK